VFSGYLTLITLVSCITCPVLGERTPALTTKFTRNAVLVELLREKLKKLAWRVDKAFSTAVTLLERRRIPSDSGLYDHKATMGKKWKSPFRVTKTSRRILAEYHWEMTGDGWNESSPT
jgi:hypothetical protein